MPYNISKKYPKKCGILASSLPNMIPMSINSRPFRGLIRPKISTMPRQKTEATVYLSIYKLSVEKKRLEDELEHIEARKSQIEQRLATIYQDIDTLKASVPEVQSSGDRPVLSPQHPAQHHQGFETLFLEY